MEDTSEKVIVDNPGKTTSKVWKFFGFWKYKGTDGIPKIDKSKAVCKTCKWEANYTSNTTNLANHLKAKHEQLGLQLKATDNNQPTLSSFTAPQKLSSGSQRAHNITRSMADFLIGGNVSLSVVESVGFKNLMGVLEPRYTVPSRKYFTETLLPSMKSDLVKSIMQELNGVADVAVTHDIWTSISTESYATVTCHFITKDWTLKNYVLTTRKMTEQHTSQNISEQLQAVKDEWSLPNPTAVTDNAANELKAIAMLGWDHISCMGHNINLAVRAALALPQPAKIIGKCRNLVSFFHRSPLATEVLLRKQPGAVEDDAVGHKLIQDVSTRWNSSLDMLQRILEQTAALHLCVLDPHLKKLGSNVASKILSYDEQTLAEHIVALLKPMKEATILLCQETAPSLPLISPTLVKLDRILEVREDDYDVIKNMKVTMSKNLKKRNTSAGAEDALQMACLVDPRFKELVFMTTSVRKEVHQKFVVKASTEMSSTETATATATAAASAADTDTDVTHIDMKPPLPSLPDPDEPPKKKVKSESNIDWLSEIITIEDDVVAERSNQTLVEEELSRFLSEKPTPGNPLDWWRCREPLYPIIARYARKYLAVPASSTPSERVFSTAGNIVSKKRSRISPKNVDMMVFLKKNRNIVLSTAATK